MLPSPFRVSCEILSSINLLPPDSLPLLLPYFLPSSAHLPLSMRSSLMSSDIAESLLKMELFLLNVVAFSDTMLLFLLDRLEYVERSLVSELVLERETLSVGVALAALSTTSLMYATFSSMSRIESGKQLLPVGVATRELRREFASSITSLLLRRLPRLAVSNVSRDPRREMES